MRLRTNEWFWWVYCKAKCDLTFSVLAVSRSDSVIQINKAEQYSRTTIAKKT